MRRRDWLLGGAALAARLRAQQPPPKAKITSSVMLWTLRGTFEEKLEAAARAGVQAVELMREYAPWGPAETVSHAKACRSFGLAIDALLATPDWNKRPVSMLDPAQRENFLADVRAALDFARRLEAPQIILMAGNAVPGRSRDEQYASLLEGTKRAGELAARANVTCILEPPGTCAEGLKLIREANNPHVRLLFDIYHEQTRTGSVIPMLTEAAPYVAVFHVADSPGRHEPGTGTLDWASIYKAMHKAGYAGYVTMEYRATGEQVATLIKALDGMRKSLTETEPLRSAFVGQAPGLRRPLRPPAEPG